MTTMLAANGEPAGSPSSQDSHVSQTPSMSVSAASPVQAHTIQTQAPATDTQKKTARRPPPAEGSRPLDKKRARDRRAQQALRDRTRSTIHNLSEQVTTLTRVVERQSQELSGLRGRLDAVAAENAVLRQQGVAAAADGVGTDVVFDVSGTSPHTQPPWQVPPLNSAPTNIADQLFLGFVAVQRRAVAVSPPADLSATTAASAVSSSASTASPSQLPPPDITPLLDRRRCGTDEVSKVASDVVRTYAEIETLPKQIAVHFLMTHLLKWLVLLDEPSWSKVPVWLRPTLAQLTVQHPAWIDRIPWPAARDYLVANPEITLDQFAAKYGTSLTIRWPYDPSMVVIVTPGDSSDTGLDDYLVNPVFEHHIANLGNWEVGDAFRAAFPEMAQRIDESQSQSHSQSLAMNDFLPICG